MDRGPAPKGLQNSAQGFNPGNRQNKRFALKGREMWVQMKLRWPRKSQSAQLGPATIGPSDPAALLGHSIWRPFRARRSWWQFPGLKPWAEVCSPCGAKNKSLSPRIVACSTL